MVEAAAVVGEHRCGAPGVLGVGMDGEEGEVVVRFGGLSRGQQAVQQVEPVRMRSGGVGEADAVLAGGGMGR
ncbi:hypothetical protein ABZ570_32520 [Micromonospora sp. NPDC007271]|uniref:hypothetical protein n=1 Tax=Micromonospora sp. NPDC007271 TaxID=3154587 RepID=UPI0033E4B3EC